MLLLFSGIVLVWLAVLVAVLGVCGLAAEADAKDERLAAMAAARRRRERCGEQRVRAPSGSARAALR